MINRWDGMTKILGIDPGTGIMGWGLVLLSRREIKPLKYGCIRTKANEAQAKRLGHIYQSLYDIIEKDKPEQVAIENLFFFKNQKTIISVSEARGVAIVVAVNAGLPVFEYTPLQIKQALTGYGRADKKQVQKMVQASLGLKEIPKPDDAADALAVAICHGQSSRIEK